MAVTAAAQTETITVGFPAFHRDLNLLSSEHPVARFVRVAVGGALTRSYVPLSESDPAFRLDLADSLRSDPKERRWSFRLRAGASFSNGREITLSDLEYSLERCRSSGLLTDLTEIDLRVEGREEIGQEYWVDLRVNPDTWTDLPLRLSSCPILERQSSELFGMDLGFGTNVVAAGKYNIVRFYSEKQIDLRRISSIGRDKYLPMDLILRSFPDDRQALTALRMGTVAAIFSHSDTIKKLAAVDETLVIGSCYGFDLIKRRGLQLGCSPELMVRSLIYER